MVVSLGNHRQGVAYLPPWRQLGMRHHRRHLLFLLSLAWAGSVAAADGVSHPGNTLKQLPPDSKNTAALAMLTSSEKTTALPDITSSMTTLSLALTIPAASSQQKTTRASLPATQPRDIAEGIDAIHGKKTELREAAIQYLCKVKEDARINEAFLKLLSSGKLDAPHRQQVVTYLVARNVLQVSPHLITMLKSPDPKTRLYALGQMDRLFSGQGLSDVERLVRNDPDKAVRSKAAMTAIWMRGFKK